MTAKNVLVLGATGNQGRAVVDALLAGGHQVRAMVRNPGSAKAAALGALGVELVQGDYEHRKTIVSAAAGVDAVFVNTSPFLPGVGMDGERRHGRAIVDALVEAAVPHVVYSSVSDADRQTGIPHFDSKHDTERYLAASGLAYTVTAPVFFSDNLTTPWNLPALKEGTLRLAIPAGRALQVVSVGEIGQFNAAVIERGPSLAGKRFNYAGDELTPTQMAAALSEATGRPIAFQEQPLSALAAASDDMARMFQWFDEVGYTADIQQLRADFPEVEWQAFRQWAAAQPWPQMMA